MNIALLGIDDDVLDLASHIASATRHELAVAVVGEQDADLITRIEPRVQLDWEWESLIAAPEIDAVLVARHHDQELHDEQLRKLAQAGLRLVVSHPSCAAMVAYELDMIRSDVGGTLIPLFPGRSHPGCELLASFIRAGADGPIGAVSRLEIERHLPQPNERSFQRYLALDAHAAARLVGPIDTVSAVGDLHDNDSYESITVHLASASPPQVRWTVAANNEPRVRLVGLNGDATLHQTGDPSTWRLEVSCGALNQTFTDWNQSARLVEDLESALAGNDTGDEWQNACRDLEIAETAIASLRRKRTLDVYGDPITEEDSFKGVMAISSCALLMFIFLAFVFLAVFEGFRLPLVSSGAADQSDGWPLALRLWPVYPLLAFLGLQFLLMVARKPKHAKVSPPKGRQTNQR